MNWYFESLNVALTPLRGFLLGNPLSRRLKKASEVFWRIMLRLGLVLGAVRFRSDRNACTVARAKVLWEEADKRGIRMREILVLGKSIDCYVAELQTNGQKSEIVFSGLPRPGDYDNRPLDTMDDKWVLKQKFLKANLPVPPGGACWNMRQARDAFRKIRTARTQSAAPAFAIVKPRAGSRGRHSMTFIGTEAELKKAFRVAKQLCFWVMVEQMLEGPVYRATLVDYVLCGVLRGDPPQVTGDGIHTVAQLVETKNRQPHPGVKEIMLDVRAEMFLSRQGKRPDSIPTAGERVALSEKIGVNYGGSSSEDYEICHPETRAMFEQAARTLGDPIVGFDFIIPDITRSWKEQACGFIEANSLPFINLHHDPLYGTPRNVAAKVWELVGQ